jgi:hypothetical protein
VHALYRPFSKVSYSLPPPLSSVNFYLQHSSHSVAHITMADIVQQVERLEKELNGARHSAAKAHDRAEALSKELAQGE